MYRKSLLCLIAAGAIAIPACGDDDPPSGDGGSSGRGGSAGSGKGGASGKGGSSGTDGGEPGTGGTGKGGAGGKGGTGDTGGTSGTDGEGATAGAGGTAESCAQGDPPQCADSSTIVLCDPDAGDTLQAFSCSEFCSTLGLEAGDCVVVESDATCDCGDPVDEECFAGAEEVCSCLQGTEIECLTDADLYGWYSACVNGEAESEDVVRCFAEGSAQACSRSVAECVP